MMEVKAEPAPPVAATAQEDGLMPHPACFSLAHLADLHLTSLRNVEIPQLLNKRAFGFFSWWRKRRIVHRQDIVTALLEDLHITQPDHIVVTGDLTHLGLPAEFAEARAWLNLLGSPEQVTVIPGNHEAYVGRNWARSCTAWAPYLSSDVTRDCSKTSDFFPSLRIRGPTALIGLCSARPSLPLLAIGSLGAQQLAGLATLLKNTGEAGLMRIVLIHHAPVPGTIKWRKRLTDSLVFLEILKRHGAELVLHGHTHTPTLSQVPSPYGDIPVIGTPSASEYNPSAGRCAQYHIYRLHRAGSGWEMTMMARKYSKASGQFAPEKEITFKIPTMAPTTTLVGSALRDA